MRAEDVRDACVVRQAKAYPVYDEEYANNVAVIRRELRLRFPGLHLVVMAAGVALTPDVVLPPEPERVGVGERAV